jgi:hypothetical protein
VSEANFVQNIRGPEVDLSLIYRLDCSCKFGDHSILYNPFIGTTESRTLITLNIYILNEIWVFTLIYILFFGRILHPSLGANSSVTPIALTYLIA